MEYQSIDAVFAFVAPPRMPTTTDIVVSEVGAMDVSRSGAQRSGDERNRPQRRQTDIVDNRCAKSHRPLRRKLSSFAQRIIIRCAGNY
jgi:hypothetical protein